MHPRTWLIRRDKASIPCGTAKRAKYAGRGWYGATCIPRRWTSCLWRAKATHAPDSRESARRIHAGRPEKPILRRFRWRRRWRLWYNPQLWRSVALITTSWVCLTSRSSNLPSPDRTTIRGGYFATVAFHPASPSARSTSPTPPTSRGTTAWWRWSSACWICTESWAPR